MKALLRKGLWATCLSVITLTVSASQDGPDTQAQTDTPVEIITVTGSRPIGFFREQFLAAENAFFDALNDAIGEEEFKIECNNVKRSFTNLSQRSCEPKYVDMIKADLTRRSLDAGSGRRGLEGKLRNLPNRRTIEQAIAKKRKEHLAKIEELVSEDPYLQTTLVNLNKAKYSLEKKKIEKYGEDWVAQETIENVNATAEFVEPPVEQ